MSTDSLFLLLAALATAALIFLQQRRSLHLLQQEHYEDARLLVWVRRRGELVTLPDALLRVLMVVVAIGSTPLSVGAVVVLAAFVTIVVCAGESVTHLRRRQIKPLDYTRRARQILGVALAPVALVLVAGIVLTLMLDSVAASAVTLALVTAVSVAPAYLTIAANRALAPYQRHINGGFVRRARATLAAVAPQVVGITGSYGKTTAKVCIGTVLSQSEPTLITPGSFNSFLGVVRTINEHLKPEHKRFVVEMGMYRAGDIAELCELVQPQVGVITAIGPAHLERMGSIEAIQAAKAELAEGLPAGGALVVNGDDPRCVAIAAAHPELQVTLYGIENPDASVRAESIRIVTGQTLFELVVGEQRIEVAAGLLGSHNVSNLLAGAAVGAVVGLDLETIGRGLAQVEPPEHRLQPLPNVAAGIVVIDDAYNANPAGARAALKVLAEHPAQRRILVTPGMVELGPAEDPENEHFGRNAARVCDHIILVGPRHTEPILRGLQYENFPATAIDVVQNIGGATEVLSHLTRAGDVILFENDLPDLYAEDETPAASQRPANRVFGLPLRRSGGR
jgi:UDP-N-acetylmuramoyl-tripeptide--D-alanyl-D-alanine ligase